MKKHFFLPAVALAKAGFLALLFPTALAAQQVTIQDDAKVGLIVTGTGNTINTTQIFGKSPEYAELKKRLADLTAAIAKKADKCEKYTDPLAKEDCRAELIALNAERDSVQKIEIRFREDVIRLAEGFSKMELNSERLRLAKTLFDEGKIREADNVLNAREMKMEGDALLAEKAREQEKLQRTDSLLRIKADEFALKARLKATDYTDSLRYDSAQIYFEQSRLYAETVDNLMAFANLLRKLNQTPRVIGYYEAALKLARSESEEAMTAVNLGNFYFDIKKMAESEKMYLRSLEIYERLAKSNPAQFERGLALTAMNLGVFYNDVQKMGEAEKIYLRSLEIYERLAKVNPAQFEPGLALTMINLGVFYGDVQKMGESEKMYLRSLEIYERLAKANPAQFEPDLALTAMNLGIFYNDVQNMWEAEKMYLRSLEIYERLAKVNPAQFEPGLALTAMNLGVFYNDVQNMGEAEKMFLRSLEIYERLAKANPAQFEPNLAFTAMNLGVFYFGVQKMGEAEKMYLRSLEIYERLAKSNPAQFGPDLAKTLGDISSFYLLVSKCPEAAAAAEKALALDSTQNWVRSNLGHSYLLRGNWDKAKSVYEEYLKNETDPAEAKKTLAKDWDELEAAGITCPEMAKARAWLKE
ncbi:MAG: tetratricopeptide repeat protein [Phycisphaerae bacterium]|nr:tetratricopeptide repeat protein [Saprospiraceae bacterium]